MSVSPQLTPMLRHYLEVKAQHPDAIVLYRMGDFYETFFEDAIAAAPILEVTLTARHKGSGNEAPMCGVPHHALETYLGKLLRAGRKVAICDQVEDPAEAKGLVRREVTRVVTPGTVSEPELLEGKEENLLASLVWDGDGTGAGAFLDVSTGAFAVRRFATPELCLEELAVLRPREVLYERERLPAEVAQWVAKNVVCTTLLEGDRLLDRARAAELLKRQLRASTLRGFGLEERESATLAAAAALAYAQETQQSELAHVASLQIRDSADGLMLDATTLANLEIFRNQRGEGKAATLVSVLDCTVTSPGGRMLREWLRRPLTDPAAIARRHDAVGELAQTGSLREELREHLALVGDVERLLGRAVLGSLTPREAAALRDGLQQAPQVFSTLEPSATPLLRELATVDPVSELAQELGRLLELNPSGQLKDGGVIAEGVDEELDRCRSLAKDSKRHVLALETREREATGIGSLKVRYNRVFGYYIEVTHSNQSLVPARFLRKQTLANAERYFTPELKELEDQILGAEERQIALEERYFIELRRKVAAESDRLRRLGGALAALDALAAFAEVAARRRYCRPRVGAPGGAIVIREGRHPVVEATSPEPFVPNDTELDGEKSQIVLLTGPNMGGKSTYLRQVALIVLMAQAGSFVPAESAELGAVDRIFTRVGASDDLARGESTFMVEMIETANILHHATARSLVILDEVGRGTATFDGLSLAWAIVEYLHEHRRPKTLFATHYHELTELETLLERAVNRTLAVKEWNDQIVFLRRVVAGAADQSYGIHVARLAGMPTKVIERAREVLKNLEAQEYDFKGQPRLARGAAAPHTPERPPQPQQLSLFAPPEEIIARTLRDLDLEQMTPLAALNLLASLKARLGS